MMPTSFVILIIVCFVQFLSIISLLMILLNFENDNTKADIIQTNRTQDLQEFDRFSSSVFCTGNHKKDRECRFLNLCYKTDSDEFLLLRGDKTRVYGVPESRDRPALLDISSVDNHNAKYFNYKDVQSSDFDINDLQNMEYIRGASILFHRFNPENLMHVIHDDLIPLYHTQRKYFPLNPRNLNFIIMDGRDNDTEYFHLYHLFSNDIYIKNNFTRRLVCFQEVIVGLVKTTTWYQFGFRIPQGPINIDNYPVKELIYFRNEFKERLHERWGSKKPMFDIGGGSRYIVLFLRTLSRKIINAAQLIFKLTAHFKMPVQTVNLKSDSIADIADILSKAFIVIGVHGAHLITILFMKPSSIVVEIFPFAVPAENYTPYKTLAKLLGLKYISWVNEFEENTITHEYWPAYLGGISELPEEKQNIIRNTKSVPVHLCCKDPIWLFRIYQDTKVDINNFIRKVDKVIKVIPSGI